MLLQELLQEERISDPPQYQPFLLTKHQLALFIFLPLGARVGRKREEEKEEDDEEYVEAY